MSVPPGSSRWTDIGATPDFAEPSTAPDKFLVIAATPGAPTHELARALWSAGTLGAPMEYFDIDHVSFTLATRWGTENWAQYTAELTRRRTSATGVFSLILSNDDLRSLRVIGIELVPSHVILFSAEHPDEQAVRAVSALWKRLGNDEPKYERRTIEGAMQQISRQNTAWETWIDPSRTTTFTVGVQDVLGGADTLLPSILAWMGGEQLPSPMAMPQLHPIPGRSRWLARFREEAR